ncbi:hypothetical protein [Paraburkholderia guartelaensis]|uniref:IPT/TIG domain-containing protein n=1 Tax=Paraburkholderia guartelaensis TaxID=2546446 RepID=A0ABU9SNZ7_9BURK
MKKTYGPFAIFGSGFADAKTEEVNVLRINGIPILPCPTVTTTQPGQTASASATKETNKKKQPKGTECVEGLDIHPANGSLIIENLPRKVVKGPSKLDVVVGDAISNQVDLLLSGSPRYVPRVIAAGLLAVLVVLLVAMNFKKVTIPADTVETPTCRIPRWKTIFIDFDSNTYSLSRVQLVAWTFVALFGWLYLSVARSMVQGMVTFSDIPDGLTGILIVSVGTSVAVGGVSAVKGGKSSGPFSPSFSDLYSVGGIIVPERFQFFLWTVVGTIGYLVYTVALDPASIQNLPTLPNGFMQLAGISAAGYVGGKLVRRAGPVLTSVKPVAVAKDGGTTMTWTLTGSGLAQKAGFALKVTTGFVTPPYREDELRGIVVTADPANQDSDPTLFKQLTVTQDNAPAEALPNAVFPAPPVTSTAPVQPRFFVILNPDGQRAEWPY